VINRCSLLRAPCFEVRPDSQTSQQSPDLRSNSTVREPTASSITEEDSDVAVAGPSKATVVDVVGGACAGAAAAEEDDPSRTGSDQASVVRLDYEGIYSELRAACGGSADDRVQDQGDCDSSPQPSRQQIAPPDLVSNDEDPNNINKNHHHQQQQQSENNANLITVMDNDTVSECDGTCIEASLVPGCPECEQVCRNRFSQLQVDWVRHDVDENISTRLLVNEEQDDPLLSSNNAQAAAPPNKRKKRASRCQLRCLSCLAIVGGIVALASLALAVVSDQWVFTQEPIAIPPSKITGQQQIPPSSAMVPDQPTQSTGEVIPPSSDDGDDGDVESTATTEDAPVIQSYKIGLWVVCPLPNPNRTVRK
jgi:hypothetical protein